MSFSDHIRSNALVFDSLDQNAWLFCFSDHKRSNALVCIGLLMTQLLTCFSDHIRSNTLVLIDNAGKKDKFVSVII